MDTRSVPLISADSHVEEPPGLWFDALSAADRERLPPEMRPHVGSESTFARRIDADGREPKLTDAEREGERHRQEVASRGTTSIDARYAVMREDGIAGECIYPTSGLYLWNIESPEPGWVRPLLPEPPSSYMKRQLHATFQVDDVAISMIWKTGAHPLLWGSDYPHSEGTYPNSRQTVQKLCGALDPADAAAIVHGNADRLFGFAPGVLETPV